MQIRKSKWFAVLGISMLLLQPVQEVVATVPVDAIERPSVASVRMSTALMLSVAPAGQRLVAVGERGFIQFSDDNGATWTQASSPVSVTLTSVRFVNALRGWSVGHGGVVLATRDGGKTWRKQLDGVMAAALMKAAATAQEGEAKAAALREAERLVQEGADKPFFDVYFSNESSGLVVGAYGLAFVTEDGGNSWRPIGGRLPNPSGLHLFKIYSDATGLWIVGERGLVMRGRSFVDKFSSEELPYKGSLYGVACSSEKACYVYGLRGNILQLKSDTHSWASVANEQPLTITTSVLAPDKLGSLIFADQGGRILSLDNQDARLTVRMSRSLPPINALTTATDGSLVAATAKGMVRVTPSDFR
ncbi:YCF48-related protein [Ferribacterium limneticum]|uniref:YCF48-related protein n=1 Tax=Ferribacterium limneticum TaxID=76259 RepID=UPI001CFB4A4E|nr:YCF48-related protein [Ferribacterium limneticum]UCV17779.1 glycosyl hydrolase [Ferribacterium limneticum]